MVYHVKTSESIINYLHIQACETLPVTTPCYAQFIGLDLCIVITYSTALAHFVGLGSRKFWGRQELLHRNMDK